MGRRLRSILPCTTNQLIPETVCYRETQSRFLKKQADQKSYYDKSGVRTLQPFKTGEAVRVKQEGEWRPANVIEIADTPGSYVVETSDGGVYRRNRRHLHKDTSQDQYNVHTDIETKTEVIQLSALKSWLQLILAKYDINGNYSSYIKATSTKLSIIIVRPSVNKLQHFVATETVT